MTELGAAWDAVNTATGDQYSAQMADAGRIWASMYRALLEGGVPRGMAGRMVERQQSTHCQLMLMGAAGQAGAR